MSGAGVRDFKRRIRSVTNTQQITKAMKMVAAAKLRKAQERAEASRPYTETLYNTLAALSGVVDAGSLHPLLEVRKEVRKVAYVVVAADRGLAGAYNTNVIRAVSETIAADERENVESYIIAVGRKVRDFYRKRGGLVAEYLNLGDDVSYADAKEITDYVMNAYQEEAFDEVYVVYAKFINALRHIPTVTRLIPLEPPDEESQESTEESLDITFIYEPDSETIMHSLLPRYLGSLIYNAMLESKASEQGARMTAMSSATENAGEIINNLTLEMNKVRQAAITDEILDIVGGAEALSTQ